MVMLRKDPNPALTAAREGNTFHALINGDSGLNAAATVITDVGAWVEIGAGKRYIVDSFYVTLTSVSDTVAFEIVTTSGTAATGVVTAQTVKYFGASAAAGEGMGPAPAKFHVPLVFTQADGNTIAMRIQTNDAGATINAGFSGWWEWLP